MNRTPIESFLDLTRKSGLVDNSRLNFYLEHLEQLVGSHDWRHLLVRPDFLTPELETGRCEVLIEAEHVRALRRLDHREAHRVRVRDRSRSEPF